WCALLCAAMLPQIFLTHTQALRHATAPKLMKRNEGVITESSGDARDRLVDEEQECPDRLFEMFFGCVLLLAVRKPPGGLREQHDDGHVRDHFGGVVQRPGRQLRRVSSDLAD